MNVVFGGDLANFAAPAIGQHVLRFLVDEGRRAKRVVERPLVVSVAGKTIMATGRYDPNADTLTVSGNLELKEKIGA